MQDQIDSTLPRTIEANAQGMSFQSMQGASDQND